MVIVMKPDTDKKDISELVKSFQDQGFQVGVTDGIGCSILGLIGDTSSLDMGKLTTLPHVERVMRVQEPYKKANRKFHPEDTVVTAGGVKIGGGSFAVIAAPARWKAATR